AEDGIRDFHVTGVQTCALPISPACHAHPYRHRSGGGYAGRPLRRTSQPDTRQLAAHAVQHGTLMRLARFFAVLGLFLTCAPAMADDISQLYLLHCQSCHGPDRLGGTGPALLPESLARIKRADVIDAIRNGRPASQMTGFGSVLDASQIEALADYLHRPTARPPAWTDADIRASHRLLAHPEQLPATPQHGADPLNLFVVVEAGNHHVVILDGDRFEPLARFPSHFALHGGPKFSPDGRYVYFASRDGWVSVYDLHNLTMIAETR